MLVYISFTSMRTTLLSFTHYLPLKSSSFSNFRSERFLHSYFPLKSDAVPPQASNEFEESMLSYESHINTDRSHNIHI